MTVVECFDKDGVLWRQTRPWVAEDITTSILYAAGQFVGRDNSRTVL